MSEPWLVARGIRKGYSTLHRTVEVLRGVDLDVNGGEVVAVTGSSGSGKTTLLNILGSLDRPDAGSILWEGREIQRLRDRPRSRLRNRTLGFVFQSHHLLPDFTALENVLMPIRIGGTSMEEGRSRAMTLLERVGLGPRSEHKPGELSGGEQQRVAVARALVHRPRLVLADEPGGNLDRQKADALHDLLLELRSEEEIGMVVVTHDEHLARRADRWLHLDRGELGPGAESGAFEGASSSS